MNRTDEMVAHMALRAPEEPTEQEVEDFLAEFTRDYPPPWENKEQRDALAAAIRAVSLAKGDSGNNIHGWAWLSHPLTRHPWCRWRKERLDHWKRYEYRVWWAKKVLNLI